MEPISMLIGALAAGASAALKDTASQAIKDTYQGLKRLIVERWGKKEEAGMLLTKHEENPESFRPALESEFKALKLDQDQDILEQAKSLLAQTDPEGTKSGKYNVLIQNGKGVQVGDHNTQTNTFK